MLICKIEYRQFGTGELLSIRYGDMGIPRVGEEVVILNESGYGKVYIVMGVQWYEDANSPKVFVYLQ